MDPSYSNPAFGVGAGGQPQQPVFGAGGVQVPISSGTGDIVLAPEKKSRKGVIIALIVAVLIIGGLFAAVFLMQRNGSGSVSISKNAELAFNKYANYLLYGEDSDAELNEERSEDTEDYMVNNLIADEDTDNSGSGISPSVFFSKAEQLWNTFYENLSDSELAQLGSILDVYKEDFEFTKIFITNTVLDDENFVVQFTTMDKTSLSKWINEHFADFVKSSYAKIREYGENGIRYYNLYAEYLEQAKLAGCLSEGGGLVIPCEGLSTIGMSDEMIEIGNEMATYQDEAISAVSDDCWKIERVLTGKDGQAENTSSDVEAEQ